MKKIDSHLPKEIDLLFDNKKLDSLKYLGILYYSKLHFRKKTLNFEQLLYYYSVIHYDNNESHTPLIYKYVRDKKNLNEIIIFLDNLNFIQTHGDIYTQTNRLKFSITDLGIEVIGSWESDEIILYLENINHVLEKYPYNTMNVRFKHLLYEGEF